ncbi:MAG: hypothetical protein IJV31_05090 [Clostridia bacterium]|nr:hypothetical protein [Clostridia bacterium]
MDYSNYPPYMQFDSQENDMYKDPMFNPISQYEQAYTYYKYLCMQMDYKIKCKEYEKMCSNSPRSSNDNIKKPSQM